MKQNKIDEILEKFRIGDTIVITNKPSFWSYRLKDKCPMGNVKYPYICKIIDIKNFNKNKSDTYISMTDDVYGWCLCILVEENKVLKLSEYRKLKLKRLNDAISSKDR